MGHKIRKAHGSQHPFSQFSELRHLIDHEPWLAGSLVQAFVLWQHDADEQAHYTCYLARRLGSKRILLILMRARRAIPAYMRLYESIARARADGASLAGEVAARKPPRVRHTQPDVDGGPWCALVVQRARHWELQIIRTGLIPQTTRLCASVEDAELRAERAATRHHLQREDKISHP
jgi:hypothetical protein